MSEAPTTAHLIPPHAPATVEPPSIETPAELTASPDQAIVERPLAPAETDLLKRSLKTGPIPLLRFMAVFVGIMPFGLVALTAMGGGPVVPENYTAIIIVTGVLGIGLGAASMARRAPIERTLKGNGAREVWGVPEAPTISPTRTVVSLSGLTFQLKAAQAQRLLPDCMNKIVYADGGPSMGPKAKSGWSSAVVLEWNGAAVPSPEICLVKEA